MNRARCAVCLTLLGAVLTGCGLGLPPAGDYATVFGQVTNSAGQPISGATVVVNDVLSAATDATGNFSISPVPTGAWSYTVTAPNYKNVGSTSPPVLTPGEKRNFPIRLMSAPNPGAAGTKTPPNRPPRRVARLNSPHKATRFNSPHKATRRVHAKERRSCPGTRSSMGCRPVVD